MVPKEKRRCWRQCWDHFIASSHCLMELSTLQWSK
ncbi:unnamed protein product [Brassica rapa subsp. trilocularis]